MSNSNNNKVAAVVSTPSTSKFSIVRTICATLNLGDEGKMDSFMDKVVKQLNKEITIVTKNQDTKKFLHDQNISELKDKLEDAKDELESSYLNVSIEKIQTKEQQNSYIETYLSNIDRKKSAVKGVENRIEDAIKAFDQVTEDYTAELASLNDRLSVLNKA